MCVVNGVEKYINIELKKENEELKETIKKWKQQLKSDETY